SCVVCLCCVVVCVVVVVCCVCVCVCVCVCIFECVCVFECLCVCVCVCVCVCLTMQRRPRGAAGQHRAGAAASALLAAELLLDLLQAGALLEAAHAVDHARGHVGAGARGPAVRVNGEDVRGAPERAY